MIAAVYNLSEPLWLAIQKCIETKQNVSQISVSCSERGRVAGRVVTSESGLGASHCC